MGLNSICMQIYGEQIIKMKKHKFHFISFTYWFLLLYIISALVWWFISLEAQNRQMFIYRYEQLRKDDFRFNEKVDALNDARHRKSLQYVGEGLTFFVLIMIGAAYVYRTIRQEIRQADQQQNFMMAITHELKTPIAVARLNLETLLKRSLQPEQQNRLLQNTLTETDRLNTLTNNILTTAQLETRQHQISQQELDFSELVLQRVRQFEQRFPKRDFLVKLEPEVWMQGEQLLLTLLISNLLDNAIKYDSSEQPIEITLSKEKQKTARLTVADHGPGIEAPDKERIFTKFYRVGSESIRKTKGTGLGLYLCKRIVQDHKGQIKVSDNVPHGAVFSIQLPVLLNHS